MNKEAQKHQVGAMELLGIIGFSLFITWLLSVFFWFISLDLFSEPYPQRSLVQSFLFLGLASGYLAIRFLAPKHQEIRINRIWTVVIFLPTLLLPILITLATYNILVPLPVLSVAFFLSGASAAFLIVSWLDICSRSRIKNYMSFTLASFMGGAFIFVLSAFLPNWMQFISEMIYVTLSLVLLLYMASRASHSEDNVVRKRDALYSHPRELEILIFIFGVLFGAGSVMLCQLGQDFVLFGILTILLAAGIVLCTVVIRSKPDLLSLMRILICITLTGVLVLPFTGEVGFELLLVGSVGLWATFTAVNYASLTRMVIHRNLSVFYHISTGLSVSAAGFFVGWIVPVFFMFQGVLLPQLILPVLSIIVLILVIAEMFFYPSRQHHDEIAQMMDPSKAPAIPETLQGFSEDEVLRLKSDAVAKLFGLSPREIEIFNYLIKGRNAEYIKSKLIISGHTVKSHIYNIYHKVNIHSQQKLINFVEEYPIDDYNR